VAQPAHETGIIPVDASTSRHEVLPLHGYLQLAQGAALESAVSVYEQQLIYIASHSPSEIASSTGEQALGHFDHFDSRDRSRPVSGVVSRRNDDDHASR
jgi:hypothetical protein